MVSWTSKLYLMYYSNWELSSYNKKCIHFVYLKKNCYPEDDQLLSKGVAAVINADILVVLTVF